MFNSKTNCVLYLFLLTFLMKILEAAKPNEDCMKDEKDDCCTKILQGAYSQSFTEPVSYPYIMNCVRLSSDNKAILFFQSYHHVDFIRRIGYYRGIAVHMGGLGKVTFDFGSEKHDSPLKMVFEQERGSKMKGEIQTYAGELNNYDFEENIMHYLYNMRMSRKTMQAVSLKYYSDFYKGKAYTTPYVYIRADNNKGEPFFTEEGADKESDTGYSGTYHDISRFVTITTERENKQRDYTDALFMCPIECDYRTVPIQGKRGHKQELIKFSPPSKHFSFVASVNAYTEGWSFLFEFENNYTTIEIVFYKKNIEVIINDPECPNYPDPCMQSYRLLHENNCRYFKQLPGTWSTGIKAGLVLFEAFEVRILPFKKAEIYVHKKEQYRHKGAMNDKPFAILDWKKPNGEAWEIPDNTISKVSLISRSSHAKTPTAFDETKSVIVAIRKGEKLPRVVSSPDRYTNVQFCNVHDFAFYIESPHTPKVTYSGVKPEINNWKSMKPPNRIRSPDTKIDEKEKIPELPGDGVTTTISPTRPAYIVSNCLIPGAEKCSQFLQTSGSKVMDFLKLIFLLLFVVIALAVLLVVSILFIYSLLWTLLLALTADKILLFFVSVLIITWLVGFIISLLCGIITVSPWVNKCLVGISVSAGTLVLLVIPDVCVILAVSFIILINKLLDMVKNLFPVFFLIFALLQVTYPNFLELFRFMLGTTDIVLKVNVAKVVAIYEQVYKMKLKTFDIFNVGGTVFKTINNQLGQGGNEGNKHFTDNYGIPLKASTRRDGRFKKGSNQKCYEKNKKMLETCNKEMSDVKLREKFQELINAQINKISGVKNCKAYLRSFRFWEANYWKCIGQELLGVIVSIVSSLLSPFLPPSFVLSMFRDTVCSKKTSLSNKCRLTGSIAKEGSGAMGFLTKGYEAMTDLWNFNIDTYDYDGTKPEKFDAFVNQVAEATTNFVIQALSMFFIFYVLWQIFNSISEASKYVQSYQNYVFFDNLYATSNFTKLDRDRVLKKKSSLLPLPEGGPQVGTSVYITKMALWDTLKDYKRILFKLVLCLIPVCFIVFPPIITDAFRQGLVRFKDTTTVHAEFQIHGSSIIAWLLKNTLEKFVHFHGEVNSFVDNSQVLPESIKAHWSIFVVIFVSIFLILFFETIPKIINKLKSEVCDYYFPELAIERAAYLYKEVLRQKHVDVTRRLQIAGVQQDRHSKFLLSAFFEINSKKNRIYTCNFCYKTKGTETCFCGENLLCKECKTSMKGRCPYESEVLDKMTPCIGGMDLSEAFLYPQTTETRGEIRGRALYDGVIQFCFLKLFSWLIYWIFAFTVIVLTITLVELGVDINSSIVWLLFQYFILGFIVFIFLPEWLKLYFTFFIIDSKDIRLCTLFLFWILLIGKPANHISITLKNMSKSTECTLDTTTEKTSNLVRNLMKDEDVKKITDMLKEVRDIQRKVVTGQMTLTDVIERAMSFLGDMTGLKCDSLEAVLRKKCSGMDDDAKKEMYDSCKELISPHCEKGKQNCWKEQCESFQPKRPDNFFCKPLNLEIAIILLKGICFLLKKMLEGMGALETVVRKIMGGIFNVEIIFRSNIYNTKHEGTNLDDAISGAFEIFLFLFRFAIFLAVIVVICVLIWESIKRILGPMQNIYSYLYSKAGILIFISRDIEKEDRRMHPTLKILPLKGKNKRKHMLARGIGAPLPLLRQLGYYLWILLLLLLITLVVLFVDDTFSRIYNATNNTLKKVLDIDLKLYTMVLPGTSFIMKGFVNVIKDKIDMFQDQLSLKDYKMCLLPIPDSVSVCTPMVILIILYISNCILATYQEKVKETLLHCCYPKRQREHELVLREKILRESQRKLAQRHMAAKTTGSAVSDSKYKSYLLSYDIVDEDDLPAHNYYQ